MPGRVLVANRGEIARRIIRACHELGIQAVAAYGPGEERALHVEDADDAYRLASDAVLPYLDIEAMIEVARRSGAAAVHPGYGFLAENAAFVGACAEAGLIFIGPPASAIRAMGDKVEARRIAALAGVEAVPGTDEPVGSAEEARTWADHHGYPVAVKAAGGGGGRGFRVARHPEELADAFAGSAGEAARYFGNPAVYVERYLEQPRHVEVQLFADGHGNALALGERDCSVQRRHQKLIEETPAPGIGEDLRQNLWNAAVSLARAVDYRGAGTVEFLLDANGRFYFLEMNTRIQVEHTITEAVTGIDLVKEQIRVAAGFPLSFQRTDVQPRGHAIECRINAEDPGRGFAPGPGTLATYREPGGPGIRVDGAMDVGATILPAYDSLIAKLITWGRDRDEAIARMERALAEFRISGVPTTIPFHQAVLAHPVFRAGEVATTFVADHPEVLPAPSAVAGAVEASSTPEAPGPQREILVEVDGRRLAVRLPEALASVSTPRQATPGRSRPPTKRQRESGGAIAADGTELRSPIQGTVVRVGVETGQDVRKGDLICVVEAMKMENELVAHRDGTVTALGVATGDAVKIGAVLAEIG
ncbi:MAG: acetyl-CoA carboxylase biotin carboxylase subunit [Chloroflexota bacterium]|nr:acetyl-CoA carboxylase biotin carboxylase subunit [Chloroflexota bacterium]MDP9471193.1 acetyl-CoA carboxylase biotin carboxylase subunit [Chloroflexota bacterium]